MALGPEWGCPQSLKMGVLPGMELLSSMLHKEG